MWLGYDASLSEARSAPYASPRSFSRVPRRKDSSITRPAGVRRRREARARVLALQQSNLEVEYVWHSGGGEAGLVSRAESAIATTLWTYLGLTTWS